MKPTVYRIDLFSIQLEYRASAQLMEKVQIRTRLLSFTDKNLLVEGLMLNADSTQVKSLMWMRFTHINLMKQRSHAHSRELMEFFGEVVHPIPSLNFEERLKELSSKV